MTQLPVTFEHQGTIYYTPHSTTRGHLWSDVPHSMQQACRPYPKMSSQLQLSFLLWIQCRPPKKTVITSNKEKITLNFPSTSSSSKSSFFPGFNWTSTFSIEPNFEKSGFMWAAGHHGGILHTIRVRPFGLSDCSTRVTWRLQNKWWPCSSSASYRSSITKDILKLKLETTIGQSSFKITENVSFSPYWCTGAFSTLYLPSPPYPTYPAWFGKASFRPGGQPPSTLFCHFHPSSKYGV